MSKVWQHQQAAIEFAYNKPGAGIFAGVGLGKTRIAIELLRLWKARRVLILGPKAGLPVWPDQMAQWNASVTPILPRQTLSVQSRFNEFAKLLQRLNGAPFGLILNYDAIWREPFAEYTMRRPWDVIICDEAHKLKAPGGKTSKFMGRAAKLAKHRLALTGTPMSQSPLDAYALYRFMDSSVFGTSFAAFKSLYAVMNPWIPHKVDSYRNMDHFKKHFDSIGYSVSAEEAGIWLPEHIDIERTCELAGEARRIYDELEHRFCADIREGRITPDNAGVRLLRLQQCTSGHIRDDLGQLHRFAPDKAALLADILEELPATEPVVVFCRFRPDLDLVRELAESLGRGYAELSGQQNTLAEWQAGRTTILGVQIQAGSAAVDFSRARYAIYYSVGYSLLDYEQSRGRIRRPNSVHQTVFYIHLVARNTVDRHVYRALKNRREVIDDIMAGVLAGRELGEEPAVGDVDPLTGEMRI